MNNTVAPCQTDMELRLQKAFTPTFLKIENESEKHRGHVNGPQGVGVAETHFAIKMTSERFKGLPRLDRYRLVFGVLADLMPDPIHALRLELMDTGESS
ncbi:BolA family protein [Candidatus Finniella inopinata]|uniref:BolA family transcriptional regulator n=1 Tax=Candidatus Finniella inopinata TaxID=1696036 RepID=A0A4Q7DHB7_9PROT|nr:BolA family protein [Candidatus Finniella inopinata]RZI46153.1 BolA family transcriptional regulator [Candidatus Finniella inopinata]